MKLMFITNDSNIAIHAENSGVERIFLDLERIGKEERQGHLDTHISSHDLSDIPKLKNALSKAELMVRVNPYGDHSFNEIERAIEYGADVIMLPMFTTVDEVQKVIEIIKGRAKLNLLLETPQAFIRIKQIVELEGIDEIHIGLNDLHLGLGLDFMFELLAEGQVEYMSDIITEKGIVFGFGGIAKIGGGAIPAENILLEHVRLKSERVILSRSFLSDRENIDEFDKSDFQYEISLLKEKIQEGKLKSQQTLNENSVKLSSLIRSFVSER